MSAPNRWITFFLLLPHLSIYYFKLEEIDTFILSWQMIIVFLSAFLLFKQLKTFNLILFAYMSVLIISTFVNGNMSSRVIYSMGILTGICIYLSYTAAANYRELIRGLFYLLGTATFINFFTMVFWDGVAVGALGERIYFLGNKNDIAFVALPAIAVTYLYSKMIYNKIKVFPLMIILMAISSCYISSSGTGITIAIFVSLFVVIPSTALPSFKLYFNTYISLFLIIVVFRLQDILFRNYIVNVLHKDITLTGRTYVWDFVFSNIGQSWVLGFGRGNTIIYDYFQVLTETHDGILEILMYSGALGLFIFMAIMLLVRKKLLLDPQHLYTKTLSFFVFAYMVVSLTESVFHQMEFWILLILSYRVEYAMEQSKNNMSIEPEMQGKLKAV